MDAQGGGIGAAWVMSLRRHYGGDGTVKQADKSWRKLGDGMATVLVT